MPGPQKKSIGKPQNTFATLRRIFSYMSEFKLKIIVIFIAIIISSVASVAGTYMIKPIIDNYIEPFIGKENPDLSKFIGMLFLMSFIYIIGAASSWLFNRVMISVATKTLYKIRVDMFSKMESLPIKFFDTHTHGEIMSRYTNDSDALREMLTNSIAQFISSGITVVSVFCMMLVLSWQLTIIVVAMLAVILLVIKNIGGKSGKYFKDQQRAIGAANGYIEEMIEGQKVVKVFCHEEKAKEIFREKNAALCENATKANQYANILMPIMMNLGNLQYVLIAIVGGALAVNGIGGLTLGAIASFLQLSKSFSAPISQVSQQVNSVVMALAGAKRIFELLDEEV